MGCFGGLQAPSGNLLFAAEPGAASAASERSLNLARASLGTQLEIDGAGRTGDVTAAATALLHDNDPLGYALPAGDTSVILALPKTDVLNRFNFVNLTAAGKVSVSVSDVKLPAESPRWHLAQASRQFSGSDVVNCDLGTVEARYVKIDFQMETPGRIDTFGLFGLPTLSRRTVASLAATKGSAAMLYNYADSSPGVVMVSPGEDLKAAQAMVDGDLGTSFRFKATDPQPMAVIDLGETRPVTSVGVNFKAGPGHLDVYLLPDPQIRSVFSKASNPPAESNGKTIEEVIARDFPAGRQPVLSVDTGKQPGLNRVSSNATGQSGRYMVLVFHPAGSAGAEDFKGSADFKSGPDFKDVVAPPAGAPLEVTEVTAYGNSIPNTAPPNVPNPLVPNLPGVGGTFPVGGGTSVVSP